MKLAVILLNAVIGMGLVILLGMFSLKYYDCHHFGNENGLVVSWSPVNGCTTTVLGTDVKIDV